MKRIRLEWYEWIGVAFAAIIVIALICMLGWCLFIYKPLTEGYVIGKEHSAAHQIYSPIHMNVNGKMQLIPYWNYQPDRWSITVQNGDNTDWWYVSESYYDSVHVGDWVTK